MSARIFVFSPVEAATHASVQLRKQGCDVFVAPQPWVSPMAPSADELVAGARGA